jgi:hypothetical protein
MRHQLSDEAQRGGVLLKKFGRGGFDMIPCLVRDMKKSPDAKEHHYRVRIALLQQARRSYKDFMLGEKMKHDAMMAWAARNMLELWVWTEYISQSDENLKRFVDDVLLDALDFARVVLLRVRNKITFPYWNVLAYSEGDDRPLGNHAAF